MPRLDAQVREDFSLNGGDRRRERLGGAVDADGGAAQRSKLFDDLGDGQAGAGLDGVGDG